jgi:hypothetical protein
LTRLLAIGFATAALTGCGGTKTVTAPASTSTTSAGASSNAPACTDTRLGGSFSTVPGSAGAGQISYTLTLTNISDSPCWVSGLPQLVLVDAQGRPLPTSVTVAQPIQAAPATIVLQPTSSAKSTARFSPDVPGPGEGQAGKPCEPVAHQAQVTPTGGGALLVPVSPPTSVCEHGSLRMTLLTAA